MRPLSLVGLAVGVLEFLLAAIAYSYSKKSPLLRWLKLFALGVLLLGIGQVLCKFVVHGVLGVQQFVGVPFKTVGLILVIYSILEGVNYENVRGLTALAVALGLLFLATSYYYLYMVKLKAVFALGHLLFLTALPFAVAAVLYKVYKEAEDISALIIASGFVLYGLATIVNIALMSMGLSMFESMSSALVIRLGGIAVMLGGFIVASR